MGNSTIFEDLKALLVVMDRTIQKLNREVRNLNTKIYLDKTNLGNTSFHKLFAGSEAA